MEDLIYWLWLNSIYGIGPKRILTLLELFGTPKKIWEASEKELKDVDGIGEKISRTIVESKKDFNPNKQIEWILENQIEVITILDEKYPKNLKNIYDPPPVLFVKGNIKCLDGLNLSIVGSRKATNYGLKVAREFAYELSKRGFVIVSGMAEGIDTSAHVGAIEAGGKTIAVLGCGIDLIYPAANKKLKGDIVKNGAVISEFPLGTKPIPQNFPYRNRIISGLSNGVLVVEAGKKSGSLITAQMALEQGRDVFAIPGSIYSKNSEGTHWLIKEGAKLTTCIDDILEEIGFNDVKFDTSFKEENIPILDIFEEKIYREIHEDPVNIEELIYKTGMSIKDLNYYLCMLEFKGLIKSLPGKNYIRR